MEGEGTPETPMEAQLGRVSPTLQILILEEFLTFAQLITYFGNFVFGFSSLRLGDFLYDVFRLQGKMGKTK